MTIAIAYPDRPTEVNLWCTVEKVLPDGSITFYVINGAWNGILYTNGTFKVNMTGTIFPGIKVWEGRAPFSDMQYNEAIQWINKQLKEME